LRGGDGSCLIDVELEMAEIVLTDAELKHLVDHRKQVIQRADGLQRNVIGRAEDAAGGSQDERVFDGCHRHATVPTRQDSKKPANELACCCRRIDDRLGSLISCFPRIRRS